MSACVCTCAGSPVERCPTHGWTFKADMTVALHALLRLTPTERGLVLCWFCDRCRAHVPPGESCKCP